MGVLQGWHQSQDIPALAGLAFALAPAGMVAAGFALGANGNAVEGIGLCAGALVALGGAANYMEYKARVQIGRHPEQVQPVNEYMELPVLASDVDTHVYTVKIGENEGYYLNASPHKWQAIHRLIETGRENLPYRMLTPNPFTRDEFDDFRDGLVAAGLATRTRGKQIVINAAGRAAARRFGSPTPGRRR
jgi:hypothetical protein